MEKVPLIGIVPGVGKLRPHRAWFQDGWLYLLEHILAWQTHLPVLIRWCGRSGVVRRTECKPRQTMFERNRKVDSALQTAAVLKRGAKVVLSGDTGPAHMGRSGGHESNWFVRTDISSTQRTFRIAASCGWTNPALAAVSGSNRASTPRPRHLVSA